MLLAELVEASRRVGGTRSRLEKVDLLAGLLRGLPPSLIEAGVAYLMGELPQGRLGVGHAVLRELHGGGATPSPAAVATLTLAEVGGVLDAVKAARGEGSAERRATLLRGLVARATALEQDFLFRLMAGELRQGALEGIVSEAVARAFAVPASEVRRAAMLAGGLPPVAGALARQGPSGLARFALELFQPIQPMLADSATDIDDALGRLGAPALEYKVDGARVQVHKDGDRVEVYSRQGNRVTSAVPEIVELVAAWPTRQLVLDGEAVAVSSGHRPLSFQTTMRRFGRRLDVAALRAEIPLAVTFFDVLRVDALTLLEAPLSARWQALLEISAARALVPRLSGASAEQAAAFVGRALADGHEGVMVKNLAATYHAGRRGQDWLKVKAAHTLDLVVLAAEWGSGRRRGWLSNLHLGARDPENGGFVMLGKTFKGMTDEVLRWQTTELLARALGRHAHVVFVRPELVVEIAFNDVQVSPQYPGGVALRFARLKRYRPDKTAAMASTLADVRAWLPAG